VHLGLDLPPDAAAALEAIAPPALVTGLMRWCVDGTLGREHQGGLGPAIARQLLYVRSHWLRMPPGLLALHLSRKALRRILQRTVQNPGADPAR
jgi:hypothetical protein